MSPETRKETVCHSVQCERLLYKAQTSARVSVPLTSPGACQQRFSRTSRAAPRPTGGLEGGSELHLQEGPLGPREVTHRQPLSPWKMGDQVPLRAWGSRPRCHTTPRTPLRKSWHGDSLSGCAVVLATLCVTSVTPQSCGHRCVLCLSPPVSLPESSRASLTAWRWRSLVPGALPG